MPNALAHQRAAIFMRKAPVATPHTETFTRALNTFGPMSLLQLHAAIAATRQHACKCLHEKDRTKAEACAWRRTNTRCNHQIDVDENPLSATGAYVAGMYVLQGMNDPHAPAFENIRQPALKLWGLDQPIRSAYRLLLKDEPILADLPVVLPSELAGATTLEELEALIEAARIPHANELDLVGNGLNLRLRELLQLDDGRKSLAVLAV